MNKNNNVQLTTILNGTTISGDINTEQNLRIEGKIKGTVKVAGELILTDTGVIEGDVFSNSAVIAGKIMGNLTTDEKTLLESKGSLSGDLITKVLIIEAGASLNGNCAMNTNPKNK